MLMQLNLPNGKKIPEAKTYFRDLIINQTADAIYAG